MVMLKSGWFYILFLGALVYANNFFGQGKEKKCIDCHKELNEKKFVHDPSKDDCKICHKPTGKEHPKEDEEGFELAEKSPQLCYSCHDPLNTKKSVHPPVKKGNCTGCHEVHSSDEKKFISALAPELCYFCHGELSGRIDTLPVLHQVVKTGSSCMNCHSPHQSANAKLLVAKEKDLCLQCHDKPITTEQRIVANIKSELDKNKYQHGAIETAGCSGCHDPHVSAEKNLLKGKFSSEIYVSAKTKDNIALCFECHESQLLEKDKTTTATRFRNGEQNLHFKHVNKRKGRNCVNCHGIHSAPNEFLLVNTSRYGNWDMPLKFTKTETGGKCITACHASKTYSRVLPK